MLHRPKMARLIALPLAFAALLPCSWLLGAIAIAGDGAKSGTPQSPSPNFDLVFIIVLVNTDFDRALEAPSRTVPHERLSHAMRHCLDEAGGMAKGRSCLMRVGGDGTADTL